MSNIFFFLLVITVAWFVISESRAGRATSRLLILNVLTALLAVIHFGAVIIAALGDLS